MSYKDTAFDVGLIGNGFDLHYGLKTTYSDFYEMVKLICESSNFNEYKDKLKYKYNDQLDLVDLVREHGADVLYNMLEKEYHNNYFVKYFLNYNSSFDKWTDFESELKNIIDCFYELKKCILKGNYSLEKYDVKVIINGQGGVLLDDKDNIFYPFMHVLTKCKLYEYKHNVNYGYNYDYIILATDFCLVNAGSDYIINTRVKDFLNNNYVQYFYNELIAFENLFVKYLQAFVEPFIDKTSLPNELMFIRVITYNYTKLFEKKFLTCDICHIHGTYSFNENNILFGIDSKFKYGDNFDWFLKANRRLINATDYSKLKKLLTDLKDTNKNTLAIFGHSLNNADEDTLKYILKQKWSKITVFFPKHIMFSKENLCRNLRNLLGDEMFENHTRDNVLFFQEI